MRKLFHMYPEQFEIPDGAHDEEILVYRACKTQKCDMESFTPTYVENGCIFLEGDDPTNPGLYSLSTYENPRHIKRFVIMTSEYGKPYKIAKGLTISECGPVQRTRERNKKRRDSHVDWWIYPEGKPYEKFNMIDDFDSYLEENVKKEGLA